MSEPSVVFQCVLRAQVLCNTGMLRVHQTLVQSQTSFMLNLFYQATRFSPFIENTFFLHIIYPD